MDVVNSRQTKIFYEYINHMKFITISKPKKETISCYIFCLFVLILAQTLILEYLFKFAART